VDIGYLLHLLCDGGQHFGIAMADTCHCGSRTGVENLLAGVEVDVVAFCVSYEEGFADQGAVE
jgi:hypothetical protein